MGKTAKAGVIVVIEKLKISSFMLRPKALESGNVVAVPDEKSGEGPESV